LLRATSVSIQTLDDAGNPAHSLDVAALSDTGSNWTYINAATWRALGQPQLADAATRARCSTSTAHPCGPCVPPEASSHRSVSNQTSRAPACHSC
jgi:hypothetical protein